ncbi:g11236 [Coccomyxa elongata]
MDTRVSNWQTRLSNLEGLSDDDKLYVEGKLLALGDDHRAARFFKHNEPHKDTVRRLRALLPEARGDEQEEQPVAMCYTVALSGEKATNPYSTSTSLGVGDPSPIAEPARSYGAALLFTACRRDMELARGMAALVDPSFMQLSKSQQQPKRAKQPFCASVNLDPHMDKKLNLGAFGSDRATEAGRRLHMDPIICASLILFAIIENKDLNIDNIQKMLVMLEAKTVQPRENEGQVLAQMAAVKDVHVGAKRKRNEQSHEQVFGLLSNAKEWYIYKYDSCANPPVQYYGIALHLMDKIKPDNVQKAVKPMLECLLGVYKDCLVSRNT